MTFIPQNPNGQATMANSSPVVIASDQSALPTTSNGSVFTFSTVNSSVAQLTAGDTFTGAIESVINQPKFSILFFSSQNSTITLNQFTDAGGTKLNQSQTFTYTANGQFARSGTLNGNFFQVIVVNNGASTTVGLQLDTAYGDIDSATQLNNAPVGLLEINGAVIDSNAGNSSSGTQRVVIATNDPNLSAINGKLPTQGVAASSASQPVVSSVDTASGTITTQNLVPAGVATAGSAVEILLNGNSCLGVQVTGTYTGALSIQATVDGTNWTTIGGTPFININTGLFLATITSGLQSIFQVEVSTYIRVRITALAAVTGTATITLRAISSTGLVGIDTSLPAGTAIIGALVANQSVNVAQLGGTTPVTGGVAGIQAVGGNVAHSAATTANPTPTGGRVIPTTIATVDTTLVAGDSSWIPITTGYQKVIKPFGTSELDSYLPILPSVTSTAVQSIFSASGTASVRNYITSLSIQTDTLGAAGNMFILDNQGAIGTAVNTGTGVFTNSGTNDLRVGDCIIFTSLGTITGAVVNTPYYITATTLAATTFVISATAGGGTLTITGTTSAFTFYRVFYMFRLNTAALSTPFVFTPPNPWRSIANSNTNVYFPASLVTGTVYLNINAYRGF